MVLYLKDYVYKEVCRVSYKFFENKECEFYPCHKINNLNCLFCFCPLYTLDCGGDFDIIKGKDNKPIKDCSNCILPHIESGYDFVMRGLAKHSEKR